MIKCLNCGVEIQQGKYCSLGCGDSFRTKKWQSIHKDKVLAYRHSERFRNMARKYARDWRQKIRLEAMKVVGHGVLKCANCGCTDLRLLEINHINGNGTKEHHSNKKSKRGFYKFYIDIVNGQRKIDDLNILCSVCNVAFYVEKKFGAKFSVKILPTL